MGYSSSHRARYHIAGTMIRILPGRERHPWHKEPIDQEMEKMLGAWFIVGRI